MMQRVKEQYPSRRLADVVGSVALLLQLVTCTVAAESAAPPSAGSEVWKERLISASVAVARIEAERDCPRGSDVIYAGVRELSADRLLLALRIDDQAPLQLAWNRMEIEALSRSGLQRMACLHLTSGEHRISADFQWHDDRNLDGKGHVRIDDQAIVRGDQTLQIGIVLQPDALLGDRDIELTHYQLRQSDQRSWLNLGPLGGSKFRYRIGSRQDPEVRSALYHSAIGQPLRAIAGLQILAEQPAAALDAAALLTRELESFGAHTQADAELARLRERGASLAVLRSLELAVVNRKLQQGQHGDAESALSAQQAVDTRPSQGWQDARFRALLADGRYSEAADIGLTIENDASYVAYVRYYNVGLALIHSGRGAQGATVLDRIGTIVSEDSTMRALVDRANLSLAQYFFDQDQCGSAIPVLGRIRSTGPYGSRALLMLGWAWLSPGGATQDRVELGDERIIGPPPESIGGRNGRNSNRNLYQRYRIRPFDRAPLPEAETARLNRALAAWAELIDRDPAEAAVRESYSAVAVVLQRLGAHQDALRFYQRSLETLSVAQAELVSAATIARSDTWSEAVLKPDRDRAPGSDWQLQQLPAPVLSSYLRDALATVPFQQSLRDLSDLNAMKRSMAELEQRLSALAGSEAESAATAGDLRQQLMQWQAVIDEDLGRQRALLSERALAVLAQQSERTTALLVQTRLALASQYENGGRLDQTEGLVRSE